MGHDSGAFTSLSYEDDTIKAYSWNGFLYTVDNKTGNLIDFVLMK